MIITVKEFIREVLNLSDTPLSIKIVGIKGSIKGKSRSLHLSKRYNYLLKNLNVLSLDVNDNVLVITCSSYLTKEELLETIKQIKESK